MDGPFTILPAIQGESGHREVLLGFAPACVLARLSFADVLDEDAEVGYQRRFHEQHSKEFKRYISQAPATTIPVTLNARRATTCSWEVRPQTDGLVQFVVEDNGTKVLAQVDGQHRLGGVFNPSDGPRRTWNGRTFARVLRRETGEALLFHSLPDHRVVSLFLVGEIAIVRRLVFSCLFLNPNVP